MPVVRLSGHVEGKNDPARKPRARLLYRLFDAGWDIYNGNGDQVITLGNIQKKIIESDAFVFTPNAQLEDMFQAASIFVGHQTNDKDLLGKPTVIHNSDKSWNGFIALIEHLHRMGTVHQHAESFFEIVNRPKDVMEVLDKHYKEEHRHEPASEPDILQKDLRQCLGDVCLPQPAYSVCVFCSASIRKEDYLEEGYQLGKLLAQKGWGCVSGAGRTGIMGKVVQGSVENEGWAAGSNVPHIIAMEGLPDGLHEFWPRADIYTRMEVMIDKSNAFIIMPGGLGTVQEALALVLLKQQNHTLMSGKPIVVVNRKTEEGIGFWDPLIELLKDNGGSNLLTIARNYQEAVDCLKA